MSHARIRLLTAFILGGAALALLAVGFWNAVKVPHCQWTMPSDRATFEADAQAIIDALDAHRARTGTYPKSLADVGISERSPYGPWQYTRFDGEFGLALGDYLSCMWEYGFSSKTRSWYYDT